MRTLAVVSAIVIVALLLGVAGFGIGFVMGRGPWGYGMMGPGIMGAGRSGSPWREGVVPGLSSKVHSLEDAEAAIERYLDRLSDGGLHITEVMEFERNYYAIVAEEETDIGAMELLIEKRTGAIAPEPGPNMMWNTRYGMHGGGMMGGFRGNGEMVLSTDKARDVAQRWLDANLPGRGTGTPDPFYGYYTLHFLKDGRIEGMLSVHGNTGQVWYHSWHGDFVRMTEHHEDG